MTFDRAAFLVKSAKSHLALASEAIVFDDMEEFMACVRRAYMAALMRRSVIALQQQNKIPANIFGTVRAAPFAGHPLRRIMIAQQALQSCFSSLDIIGTGHDSNS